jgi:hypothetical protein
LIHFYKRDEFVAGMAETVLLPLLLLLPTAQPLIEKIWEIDTCGPPKIQNTMMNQTVVPGEYAHFKCQVDMSKCMVAYIDWYHERMDGEGGREKIKNARTRGDPHTHSIQRVHPLHEGLYTCVVGNVLGKAEASAYLQVNSGLPPLSHVPIGLLLLLVPFQTLAR